MSAFFAAVDVGDSVQQGLDALFAFVPGAPPTDGPTGSRRLN